VGAIDARLAGHDRHFHDINGQLARIADEMRETRLAVQRLADAATADRSTAVTTAAALKDADAARRAKSETAWSPLARLSLAVGVVATVVTLAYLVLRPT
jgi:hypothetical protein